MGCSEQCPHDSMLTKFICLIQGRDIDFYGKIIQKASVLRYDLCIWEAVDITPSGSFTHLIDRIKASAPALPKHAPVTPSSWTIPVAAPGLQIADLIAVMQDNDGE